MVEIRYGKVAVTLCNDYLLMSWGGSEKNRWFQLNEHANEYVWTASLYMNQRYFNFQQGIHFQGVKL